MDDLYIFDQYNPLQLPNLHSKDTVSKYISQIPAGSLALMGVSGRASLILKNRCIQEVAKILMDIDDFTCRDADLVKIMEITGKCSWRSHQDIYKNPTGLYWNGHSSMALMGLSNDKGGIDEVSKVTNLSWSECFAAIACGHVASAARYESYEGNNAVTDTNFVKTISNFYVAPAIEASTIAMMLNENKAFWAGASRQIYLQSSKQNSSKGGKKKSERNRPLKDMVVNLHDEKYSSVESARGAASKILTQLSDDELTALDGRPYIALGNELDRIAAWIRAHRKTRQTYDPSG